MGTINKTLTVGKSESTSLYVSSARAEASNWPNPYLFTLTVKLNSQNITNNSSNIDITLSAVAKNDYWNSSSINFTVYKSDSDSYSASGDNYKTQAFSGFTYTEYQNNTSKVVVTWPNVTVNHNTDGSKILYVNASGPGQGSSLNNHIPKRFNFSTSSVAMKITLPTIARASTVTYPNTYSVTSTSTSSGLSVTVEPKASYYHKIVWKIGSTEIKNESKTSATSSSFNFTVSNSNLLNYMPNSTATVVAEVSTYSNSSLTTQVGNTVSATIGVTVDTNSVKPTINTITLSGKTTVATSGSTTYSYYIAGVSKPTVSWTGTNKIGAGTYSYTITITPSLSSLTPLTQNRTDLSSDIKTYTFSNTFPSYSTDNYNVTVVLNVTDSRGGSATATWTENGIQRYRQPNITLFDAYRVANSSSDIRDPAGTVVRVKYTVTYSTIPSSGTNRNTLTVSCKNGSTSLSTGATYNSTFNLTASSTATITLAVADKVTTLPTRTIIISQAVYPLDLYDNSSGLVGVGLGTIAESGFVKTELPTKGFFLYGTCATARATARKVVSDIPQFTSSYLVTGTTVFIKFTNANGVANPTLSINGTTAKSIKRYGTTAPSTSRNSSWNAGSVVCLIYDGTYWQQVGYLNNTYSEISRTDIQNMTGTSAGTITGRRFKSGFDANMASYVTGHTDIVMAKTTSSAIQYATGGQFGHVPPWTFIKNIGTGFSETSGGGNIICNKAGTIKVTTKCFFSSGGNQTRACYVRHNGVDISDTGTTAVVNNSNTLYNEALVDVAANDTININVQKRVDNSTALNLQGQSTIIVEYIAYS